MSLTSYVEWALGAEREHTRHQLHTRVDAAIQRVFARNFFAPDFTSRVAFSWIASGYESHRPLAIISSAATAICPPRGARTGELSGAPAPDSIRVRRCGARSPSAW